MSFYSRSEGYVAFKDWLGYTTDSGRTFTKIFFTASNVTVPSKFLPILNFPHFVIMGVKAFNKDTLFAFGNYAGDPAILYSTNHGNTFTMVYYNTNHTAGGRGVMAMAFPGNANMGFATYADGILQTNDRGKTWFTNLYYPNILFSHIEVLSDRVMYVFNFYNFTTPSLLMKTTDGGETWNSITYPRLTGHIQSLSFLSEHRGFISLTNGGLYYTSNSGSSWIDKSDLAQSWISGIHFINDSTGYGIISSSYLSKTTDSGRTWERLPYDATRNGLYFTYFFDNDQFWVGSDDGNLLMTTNSGGASFPASIFQVDTTNLSATGIVHLVNFSNKYRQYKWFKNDTLISTSYNASYTHDLYKASDTIRLEVSNGVNSGSSEKIQYFIVPPPKQEPAITSFTPAYAGQGGTITIYGYNLNSVTAVSFGGVPATSFTKLSPTVIKAVVGIGASGKISVINPDGTAEMDGFTFLLPPTIASFFPTEGVEGDTITIKGTNFTTTTQVLFGGRDAATFKVVSDTLILARLGMGDTGAISVKTPAGIVNSANFLFHYPPHITDYNISAGAGETIIITGTSLALTNSVTIGGVPAASFTVVSNTTVTVVLGDTAYNGTISLTTPYGTAFGFMFIFRVPPIITSFTPDAGGNGTTVTINGIDLRDPTAVSFGGVPAKSFVSVSPKIIRAVVGSGATGNVSVTTQYGTATMGPFTWYKPPVITSFSPTSATGSTIVIIKGQNFNGSTAVNFGAALAPSFTVTSDTTIEAIVSTGSSGNVSVVNPAGTGSLAGFTFISSPVPTITSISPLSGPAGTTVTITGTNFNPVISGNIVRFGAVKATITAASATTLTVTVPTGATYQPIMVTSYYLTVSSSQLFNVSFPGSGELTATSYPMLDSIPFSTSLSISTADHTLTNDIDGDGKPDIILIGTYGYKVLRNTGSTGHISFAPLAGYLTDLFGVQAGTVGDLDGDGKSDLAITTLLNSLTVLRNISIPGTISHTVAIDKLTTSLGIPFATAIGDLNGDGKPDIAVIGPGGSSKVSVYRNTSQGSNITLSSKTDFTVTGIQPKYVAIRDLDGDGKPELIVLSSGISIFRNTSTGNSLSFAPRVDINGFFTLEMISSGDLDGDGKTDIAVATNRGISILRNTSTTGNISFDVQYDILNNGRWSHDLVLGDLTGDGKPDLAISEDENSDSVTILKNISTAGSITFAPKVQYFTGLGPQGLCIEDFDGDGKPELLEIHSSPSANHSRTNNTICFLGNFATVSTVQLCSGSGTSFTSNISGSTYQWQQNTGSGFVNISNNSNFNGTNTATLQLSNIPASWTNYQYRCMVDGNGSTVFETTVNNSAPVSVSINSPFTNICFGTAVTFTATPGNAGNSPGYQWMVNGINAGTNSNTFTSSNLTNGSEVKVLITGNNSCASTVTATSNAIVMTVNPTVTASVTINASETNICPGTNVLFNAVATNVGSAPIYQWQKNGVNVGTNSVTYSNNTLQDGDIISLQLRSNANCILNPNVTSNNITIHTTTVATPAVSINASSTSICTGQDVTFTATPTLGGVSPAYQWQVNGVNAGTNSNTFTTNTLSNGAQVKVTMTSNATCTTSPSAISNTVTIQVVAALVPLVAITGNTTVNQGQATTLLASSVNGGTSPAYQWQDSTQTSTWKNITGATNVTLQYVPAASDVKVRCILTSNLSCVTTTTATSIPLVFTVNAPTAINPVPASDFGIHLYPNPIISTLTIDTLKLSERWETLEIISVDGKQKLITYNIKNQSRITISVARLSNGLYVAVLRRKNGVPVYLKFLKNN